MVVNKVLGGRPPLVFPDSELDALGKDLLDWLDTKEGKKAIFFQDWFFYKHGMARSDWKLLIQREGFRPYYDIARKKLANNMMNSELDKSFTHRYVHKYDDELRDFEREIKAEDYELKSKDSSLSPQWLQDLAKMQEFFAKVQSMQLSKSTEPEADRKD